MSKYNKEKYEEYIKIGFDRAKSSLNHFFELLDIPPHIFDSLFDIDIIIDYEDEYTLSGVAYYKVSDKENDDEIIIAIGYLDRLFDSLENNNLTRQGVINEIAKSIIHELLHRNRTIIINNSLKVNDLESIKEYKEKSNRYNLDLLKNLLNETINNGLYDIFDNNIPLKVVSKENGLFTIFIYNKKTECFEVYEDESLEFLNIKDFNMINVGIEFNSGDFKHNKVDEIKYTFEPKDEDFVGPDRYYHKNKFDRKIDKIAGVVDRQIDLEEIITETLTELIIFVRKSNSINLEEFRKFEEQHDIMADLQIASKMLEKMGLKTIRWFILSSHEDEYDDELYKTYSNKYEALLRHFSSLFMQEYNNSLDEDIDAINDIVTNKNRR